MLSKSRNGLRIFIKGDLLAEIVKADVSAVYVIHVNDILLKLNDAAISPLLPGDVLWDRHVDGRRLVGFRANVDTVWTPGGIQMLPCYTP